jgi:hypothetical protein
VKQYEKFHKPILISRQIADWLLRKGSKLNGKEYRFKRNIRRLVIDNLVRGWTV